MRASLMRVDRLNGKARKTAVVLLHAALVVASFYASFALRLDLDLGRIPVDTIQRSLPFLLAARLLSLAYFRLFRGVWRYVAIPDLVQIVKATTVSSVVFAGVQIAFFGLDEFPRSVFLIDWAGNIFLLSGVRLAVRVLRERSRAGVATHGIDGRLLIVGAGDAGASLCAQALTTGSFRYTPVAFADVDPEKVGQTIQGVPIVGRPDEIPAIVRELRVDMAVIAVPSASPSEKRRIIEICREAGVPCKILPATSDLVDGSISVSEIREVDVTDLLGRPQAELDRERIRESIRDRVVLVTGAAGSVGSELARQISGLRPHHLVLADFAENPLVFTDADIRASLPAGTELTARVVDVTNEPGLMRLMREFRPDTVFHAAAHKHVHLMEAAPAEAVKNNVGGTLVAARCAMETGAHNFVLVSTDKAVNPTSVMGATKRIAELLVREIGEDSPTRFVAVRFGNVLGSNASVVPIFERQIRAGGPVTVTHPDATRYFMSTPEAAALILQAAAVGRGGEVFVLDMGEPIKITTLAETLITLSGLTPGEDIEITFTGLRPGEKLSEELNFKGEEFERTGHQKLLVLRQNGHPGGIVQGVERLLSELPALDGDAVKRRIAVLVPEYQVSRPVPLEAASGAA